jgi:uncharacterized protein
MQPYASVETYESSVAERSQFMRRVYGTLAFALLAFVALEAFLLSIPAVREAAVALVTKSRFMWLAIMIGFMAVTWFAQKMAMSSTSQGKQYAGLAIYIVAEALVFLPILALILMRGTEGGSLLTKAGLITGGLFMGLSTVALTTKKDLSFMQRFVKIGMWVALGIMVASILFGFTLGIIFISAMILLMTACILYQTQQIYREWPGEMHVAGALTLFASFVTLLWYVIQLLLSLGSSD